MNFREELYLKALYKKLKEFGNSRLYTEAPDPFIIGQRIGADREETKGIITNLGRNGFVQNIQGYMAILIKPAGVTKAESLFRSNMSRKAYRVSEDEYKKAVESSAKFNPHYDCYLFVEKLKEYTLGDFIARILWRNYLGITNYICSDNAHSNSIVKDVDKGELVVFTLDKKNFLSLTSYEENSEGVFLFRFVPIEGDASITKRKVKDTIVEAEISSLMEEVAEKIVNQDLMGAIENIQRHKVGDFLFQNVILWKSGLKNLDRALQKGIISDENFKVERNQIIDKVLGTLAELRREV